MQLSRLIKPADLQDRIYATYISLRRGLAVLAFLLPVVLVGWGYCFEHIPIQGSMSNYYFAFVAKTPPLREFPMRVWFVGTLFAIGFFLYLYKGFSRTENIMLNIAGLAAVVVALFHMKLPEDCADCGTNSFSWVHGSAAFILFGCLAFVAWACADDVLVEVKDQSTRDWIRKRYFYCAIAMVLSPVAAVGLTFTLGSDYWLVLIAEWLGVWSFAAYWSLKSYELGLSKADKKAIKGEMAAAPVEKHWLRKGASRMLG